MNDITADPDRQTGGLSGHETRPIRSKNDFDYRIKVFSAVLLSCAWGSGWDQLLRAITKHHCLGYIIMTS